MKNDISLPYRIRVQGLDSETGSYGTISRTGDQDRSGRYNVRFDDNITIVYTASNLSYPALMYSSSQLILGQTSSLTATGSLIKGLSDDRIVLANSGEALRPFNEGRLLDYCKPNIVDPFYSTGSHPADVSFGFTGPTFSKTIIAIDLTPTIANSASIQNGATSDATNPISATNDGAANGGGAYANRQFLGASNYPMMYYNFDLKKWEGVGRGLPTNITGAVSASTPNTSNMAELSVRYNLDEQMYGFAPSYGVTTNALGHLAAKPMSTYGFPIHPKFHATSSQLLQMSRFIDRPFILEKIVYEFSGSYMTGSLEASDTRNTLTTRMLSAGSGAAGDYGAPISTFFMLNQRGHTKLDLRLYPTTASTGRSPPSSPDLLGPFVGVDPSTSAPWRHHVTATLPTSIQLSKGAAATYVDTLRELVTYAQVSALGTNYTSTNLKLLSRDLNITGRQNLVGTEYWSGKFVMSASVKSMPSHNVLMPMYLGINDVATYKIISTPGYNQLGGRAVYSDLGRSFRKAAQGSAISSSITFVDPDTLVSIKPSLNDDRHSPYIMMPTDNIIFGWQVPIGKKAYAEGQGPETLGWASALNIAPGAGRLLLFGSLVRNERECHETMNQPLTSNAIHEIIGESLVSDQFETEPREAFSGSFIGVYVTGSITASTVHYAVSTNNFPVTPRGIAAASFVKSTPKFNTTQVTSDVLKTLVPGFSRMTRHVNAEEKFYDCMLPVIADIHTTNGGKVVKRGSSEGLIVVGHDMPQNSDFPIGCSDETWSRAFPFEPKYAHIPRQTTQGALVTVTHQASAGTILPASFVTRGLSVARSYTQGEDPGFPGTYLPGYGWILTSVPTGFPPVSYTELAKAYFGVGDFVSGSAEYSAVTAPAGNNGAAINVKPRGFKYGIINAAQTFTSAVWRHNRYGQLRDMLEQRLDSKFYNTLSQERLRQKESPVGHSPVQVLFVEPGSLTLTQPMRTWSSNLSNEATSSLPFFDDVVRNRTDPIDESELNSAYVVA